MAHLNKSRWKISALVSILIFAFAASVIYFKTAPKPLRVAVMTWGGAGPGFVGQKKDLFGGLNVEFHILDDTRQRQAAYQSDEFDIYLTNPDQHPKEVAMGIPGKMFMLSDFSEGADGLIARPSIDSISKLKGKRVAYIQGSASDFMLSKALASVGLSRNEIQLVELDDPNTASVALISGQVDAAVSWEPLMSQAVKSGQARILFTSRDVPDSIIGVFIAKDRLLKDGPRLKRFIGGWLKSIEYYNSHQDESLEIMARAFNVDIADMRLMMRGLRLATETDNSDYFYAQSERPTKMDLFTAEAAMYWRSIGLLPRNRALPDRWVPEETRALYQEEK